MEKCSSDGLSAGSSPISWLQRIWWRRELVSELARTANAINIRLIGAEKRVEHALQTMLYPDDHPRSTRRLLWAFYYCVVTFIWMGGSLREFASAMLDEMINKETITKALKES